MATRKPRNSIVVASALAVSDFLYTDTDQDYDEAVSCAFELAGDAEGGVLEQERAFLKRNKIKSAEIKKLKMSAEFLECDSGNVNHAGAHYNVTIKCSDSVLLNKIKKLYSDTDSLV